MNDMRGTLIGTSMYCLFVACEQEQSRDPSRGDRPQAASRYNKSGDLSLCIEEFGDSLLEDHKSVREGPVPLASEAGGAGRFLFVSTYS